MIILISQISDSEDCVFFVLPMSSRITIDLSEDTAVLCVNGIVITFIFILLLTLFTHVPVKAKAKVKAKATYCELPYIVRVSRNYGGEIMFTNVNT